MIDFQLDIVKGSRNSVLIGCAVGESFIPALENVAQALAERNPKASADQLLDMIFLRGLTAYTDDLNLPRIGSNPDVDG